MENNFVPESESAAEYCRRFVGSGDAEDPDEPSWKIALDVLMMARALSEQTGLPEELILQKTFDPSWQWPDPPESLRRATN